MFEILDDAAVIDRMEALLLRGELRVGAGWRGWVSCVTRRAPEDDVDRINWAIDGHSNVVAEISAALNISRGLGRRGSCSGAIALRGAAARSGRGVRHRGD